MTSGRAGPIIAAIGALGLAAVIAGAAAAQPPTLRPGDDLSRFSDDQLRAALDALRRTPAPPRRVGIFGIGSGFGLDRGVGIISAAATDRRDRRRLGDWDGSVAAGFGIGRLHGIGATALVTITSVTPRKFGSSGTVGLAFDRRFALGGGSGQASVALTLGNLARWGDSAGLEPTASLAGSVVLPATIGGRPVAVMATAGWGTGVADLGRAPGAFGGIGIGIAPRLAASVAWSGDEGIAGLTAWLGRDGTMQVSVGVGDVTNARNGRRLLFSAAWRFDMLRAASGG